MRLLLLVFASAALLCPVAATAEHATPTESDGTLVVRNGTGYVSIWGRGVIVGRFDRGTLIITDPVADDGPPASVVGADHFHDLPGTKALWQGSDVTFKMIGGTYRIRFRGTGLDASAVGKGSVWLNGDGARDGRFSLDGGPFISLPDIFSGPFSFGG
jgi:hypothetical protein